MIVIAKVKFLHIFFHINLHILWLYLVYNFISQGGTRLENIKNT